MSPKTFLLAAALAGSAGPSLAALPAPIVLSPAAGGTFSGSFSQPADGLAVDTFAFSPASFNGVVSVSLVSLSGPFSFFSATLNDQNFSFFPELGRPFAFSAAVTSGTPLSLTVFGAVLDADGNPNGVGAYGGTITAAIPEPQQWALLLAGLAGIGLTARRRQADGAVRLRLQPGSPTSR